MKKNLFLAALAGVALVGCAKNEVAQVTDDSQREITFAAPVVAPVTKADEIDGTFPNTEKFKVYAYYSVDDFNPSTAVEYMTDVEVSHDPAYDNSNTPNNGGWHANPAYYWPKVGKLTFEAYYPTDAGFTATATSGFTCANYVAKTAYSDQKDLLYSDRVKNKVSSNQESEGNTVYDGIDITFNHALSVVRFNVQAVQENVVAVKSIKFVDITNEGSFSQDLSAGTSTWNQKYTVKVPYSAEEATTEATRTTFAASQLATTSNVRFGKNMIVLPQGFGTGKSADAAIEIEYFMKPTPSSSVEILQKHTFKLNSTEHKEVGGTQIEEWKMGYRYTYNLVFDLDEIYLAPQVDSWIDVTVNVPTI